MPDATTNGDGAIRNVDGVEWAKYGTDEVRTNKKQPGWEKWKQHSRNMRTKYFTMSHNTAR